MKKIVLGLCLTVASLASAQIRYNQVGYAPDGEKIAVVERANWAKKYKLLNESGIAVWKGKALETTLSPLSQKQRQTVDFSAVTTPGTFRLIAKGDTAAITITQHPLHEVARLALDAYRIQRCQHPDTAVLVHPSAATTERPEGTIISCPGGWYDAGDYNKYPVNAGFSHGILFTAYEAAPEYFESLPNFLPENKVDLDWMLTMQDLDGGVYHKLTTPNFEEHIQPQDCKQQRWVVQKSTQATLDFAAAMAMAARIYKPTEAAFSAQALEAARKAYAWALEHPTEYYDQKGNNTRFNPECTTGMYDDNSAVDEFLWAATELYITTGDESYKKDMIQYAKSPVLKRSFVLPVWGDVAGLAIYSAINHKVRDISSKPLCDAMLKAMKEADHSAFHTPHGNKASDFCWGSNGEVCAGQGLALYFAYQVTKDARLLKAAHQNMDYLLGRNAVGYCFVTGMGKKWPQNPHHRLSDSDDKPGSLPGFLVGGPNAGKQDLAELKDGWVYPEAADECYLDYNPSYATNEVAINWNAYLLALASLLDSSK